MQGEGQAKLINQLLLERLTPEEIEHRELICGDSYAFQGDERDVIFLSMVAAPNQRIGALTKDSDRQRFNAAASRARDQVWLFHTATRNDLNTDCMRHKLLAYYSNPAEQPLSKPDWGKCDSGFERDVGKTIYAKNFRLIPQYAPFGPGGYRIDFVIEGLKSRLAVECDGPHHDDPEQIERDMHRQRQLERCGWVFWRVSESKVDVLPLHATLQYHPIVLTCFIYNAGPETANEVCILLRAPNGTGVPDYDKLMWKATSSGWPGLVVIAERSVHPEEMIHLFRIEFGQRTRDGADRFAGNSFSFGFAVFARNQVPLSYQLTVFSPDVKDDSTKKEGLVILYSLSHSTRVGRFVPRSE